MRELIYSDVEHDWKINEQGDFHFRTVYTIKNISSHPISIIPEDNGYWFLKPDNINFKCRVLNQSGNNYSIVEYQNNLYETLLKFFDKPSNFIFAWKHTIDPPIHQGDSILLEITIDTKGTEKDAFSESGTFAGIPVNLPTKHAKLNYTSPTGYRFSIITPIQVIDSNRNIVRNEIKRIKGPILSAAKTMLTWEIENLLTNHRYMFKYNLVKED